MRTLIVSLIALVVLGAAPDARASRQVRVYEVNVSSQTDAAVQAQSALRQVLVRATGARDAANDPALAGVLAQASQYVLGTRPVGTSKTLVTLMFDGAALERDITAAGRTTWPSERPLLLIVLTGGPAAGAFETRRQVESALDSVANRRGQPINTVRPIVLELPPEGEIPVDAALSAAQRARGDAVLIGYGDSVADGGPWRWVLAGSGVNESWSGTLEDGVNGAADVFVRNAVAFAAVPDVSLLVEVEGVPGLREYAQVSAALSGVAGVRGVQLAESAGTRATFAVVTRGGVDGLQNALGANPRFERAEPRAGGTIAFRYRP
jgi:hypothetical protein